jgi:hypothetical protein
MPRFKCNDPECECYGIEELIPHVRFIWNDKTMRLEAEEANCSKCGRQREVVKESGNIVVPYFKAENAKNYQNKTISKNPNKFNY